MVVGHGCAFYGSGTYSKLKSYNIKVQGWSTMFLDQSALSEWTFVKPHLQG